MVSVDAVYVFLPVVVDRVEEVDVDHLRNIAVLFAYGCSK